MAITRAQQYRQMLKNGKVAMQGGVKNYLGKKKMVTVPKNWQSGPDHPKTELAYITKAEKDLLIKKNLHNSLNGRPNRGPAGVMSLNGWGDKGDTSDRSYGGGNVSGGGDNKDYSGYRDTGTGNYEKSKNQADIDARIEYEKAKKERERQEKIEEQARIEKEKLQEQARIEKEKKEKLQEEVNRYNQKKVEKLKSFVDKDILDLVSEDELDDVNVTDKGIFGNLNDIRTDLSRKTLVNSIAQKLGVMPKSYVPSVFMSDMLRTTPKGITTDSLTDMLSPDFDMGLYGISGKDLTKAQQQLNVAKQDRISQSDFDSVYGNKPPEQRGGGGDPYIPPVVSPEPDEEIDPNSLEGILANRGIAYRFMADGGRAGFAGGGMPYEGGIMDLESARQMYGLGKLVKKATGAISKIMKSPVGKAALLAGGAGLFGYGPAAGLFGSGKGLAFKQFLMGGKTLPPSMGFKSKGLLGGILDYAKANPYKTIFGGSALAGLLSSDEDETQPYYRGPGLDIDAIRRDPYGTKGPAFGFYAKGGDVKEPVAKDTMPLLDMNGMEKDYRADGGFVPIGRMERADDVPARLSKNEFVFTADAVRNAGEGDIDKGAEVMYNVMKNLEAGGNISEESQGLNGARNMFQTSKRLEEVL